MKVSWTVTLKVFLILTFSKNVQYLFHIRATEQQTKRRQIQDIREPHVYWWLGVTNETFDVVL